LVFASTICFFKSDTLAYSDVAFEIGETIGQKISTQAIGEKMKKADHMFRSLINMAFPKMKGLPSNDIKVPGVKDILIADATSISLNNELEKQFPSTGSGGRRAGIKIHALYNLNQGQLPYLKLTEASCSDHTTRNDHILKSQPGDLIIRDLGYFDAKDLDGLHQQGRFFISRISLTVSKFNDWLGNPFDIWKCLETHKGHHWEDFLKVSDGEVFHRVIALRLPRHKWKNRLDDLTKEKGRSLTKLEKTQAKWNLMITNLSIKEVHRETIQRLYEVRWQIELLWKALKTALGIDRLRAATCEAVIRTFIYARLLNAVLLLAAHHQTAKSLRKEIGLIDWFKRVAQKLPKIREMIRSQRFLALARLLAKLAKHCSERNHSKTSTRKKINESNDLYNKCTKCSNP